MSVRTALEEDGPTGAVAASPVTPGEGGAPDTSVAGRRALREARRARRRLLGSCAAIVAVCLLMTVLIVGMARDRPAQGLPSTGVAAGTALAAPSHPTPHPHQPRSNAATASEGGHR